MAIMGEQLFCGSVTAGIGGTVADICQVPVGKRWMVKKLIFHYDSITDAGNVTDVILLITDSSNTELKKIFWKDTGFIAASSDTGFKTVDLAKNIVLKDQQKLRLHVVGSGISYSVTIHAAIGGAEEEV